GDRPRPGPGRTRTQHRRSPRLGPQHRPVGARPRPTPPRNLAGLARRPRPGLTSAAPSPVLPTSLAATVPTLHQIPLTCPGISRPPVCHNRKGKHRPLLQYTILSFGEDSDYVFVNLWGEPFGHPWGYPAVYDLVVRLRRITGIDFDPHWYRHTYATRLLRQNTPIEVV